MSIRVLYVSPGVQRHGGAERVLLGLLDALDRSRVEPGVIVFGDGDMASSLRERHIDVAVVPVHDAFRPAARYEGTAGLVHSTVRAGPRLATAVHRIRGEAKRFGADIIHTNGTRAHVMARALRSRRRGSVATLHDLPQSALEGRIMAFALGSADAVVANSPMVARAYAKLRIDCRVVDNPVPAPAPRDRSLARERLGLPLDGFTVASLSHFHWYKGQIDLVNAFSKLGDDCHLLLAGGALYGPPSERYLRSVQEAAQASPAAERIHVIGVHDDVSWIYAAADAVAHCSVRPEPFGMVIIEALLSGTPVVASACGNPAEMLDDAVTALLYPPGSVTSLSRCLQKLHDDRPLAARMGAAAHDWATARFAPGRHAGEMMDIYEALMTARQEPVTTSRAR